MIKKTAKTKQVTEKNYREGVTTIKLNESDRKAIDFIIEKKGVATTKTSAIRFALHTVKKLIEMGEL